VTVVLYCERTVSGWWAEPLNAVTSLAYLAAAWSAWSLAQRRGILRPGLAVLIGLAVAIGIGSVAFHTVPSIGTRIADELPILLFQLLFLCLYARDVAGLSARAAAVGLAVFVAAAVWCRGYPNLLNGSLVYAPAVVVTALIGCHYWLKAGSEHPLLLAAAALLVLAVGLRTLDLALCPTFPIGTHFLWHLATAGVLYLSLRALILNSHA
jgi:hypothetical protein